MVIQVQIETRVNGKSKGIKKKNATLRQLKNRALKKLLGNTRLV